MSEKNRVESISDWYLKEQLDFDKRLIRFRYLSLKRHIQPGSCLELGPAEGEMTQFLVKDVEKLTVVDGAGELLDKIPDYPGLVKVNSLFEDFETDEKYDTIVMEHILEHVDDPVALLKRVRNWLSPAGKLLIGVPNGNSIHRLVAVKMGLLKHHCDLNGRDVALGHRRVYTSETLQNDILEAGFHPIEIGGVFFKPLSNQQIQDNWSEEMIQGFYELGKDFPEYAAELYAVCN